MPMIIEKCQKCGKQIESFTPRERCKHCGGKMVEIKQMRLTEVLDGNRGKKEE